MWCKFTNKYGSINWYSYEQFGEYELSIVENGKGKKYWILLDSMPPLLKIDKKNSFFGTLLKDQRIIYWDQISTAV